MSATRTGGVLALAAAVCLAASALFVRWAAPIPSHEIAFWRLLLAGLAVLLVAVVSRQPPRYRLADWPLLLAVGLVTAAHFLTYIASVAFTTVAHSLSLVYTAPLFVALLAAWRLGERLAAWQVGGMGLVVVGVAVLTGFEPRLSGTMLLGDGLALVSAATFGLYSLAGRGLRHRYPLLTYTAAIYTAAALWLLPAVVVTWQPDRYTLSNSLAVLALGLIPLGLGHTLYNAALHRAPAAMVNSIATQEVTGGVLLAGLFLGEQPSSVALLGVVVTLAGVLLVLRAGSRSADG